MELNSAAKLLTKFITSANKRIFVSSSGIRDMAQIDDLDDKPQAHHHQPNTEKPPKKATAASEPPKKKPNPKPEQKDDGHKPSREMYSYKDHHLPGTANR